MFPIESILSFLLYYVGQPLMLDNHTSATERWSAFLGGKSNNGNNNNGNFISFNGNFVPLGQLTNTKIY